VRAPPVVQRGTLTVAPGPAEFGWSVSLDGAAAVELPRRFDVVSGPHTLVFTSKRVAQPISRTVNLPPGGNVTFAEKLVSE